MARILVLLLCLCSLSFAGKQYQIGLISDGVVIDFDAREILEIVIEGLAQTGLVGKWGYIRHHPNGGEEMYLELVPMRTEGTSWVRQMFECIRPQRPGKLTFTEINETPPLVPPKEGAPRGRVEKSQPAEQIRVTLESPSHSIQYVWRWVIQRLVDTGHLTMGPEVQWENNRVIYLLKINDYGRGKESILQLLRRIVPPPPTQISIASGDFRCVETLRNRVPQ